MMSAISPPLTEGFFIFSAENRQNSGEIHFILTSGDYILSRCNSRQELYVYFICGFTGAVLFLFRQYY